MRWVQRRGQLQVCVYAVDCLGGHILAAASMGIAEHAPPGGALGRASV